MKRTGAWAGWGQPLTLAVLTVVLFVVQLASPMFADPDSFYHAKMAQLIRDRGVVQSFPWLPYTELARHYADQHFLYHALLIPFVSYPNPLVGLKIATVALAAAFVLVFYSVMRALRIDYAFVGSLLFLFITPLTFRLGLAKGNAFALILLLLALYALFAYRPKLLATVSSLYVWSHNGFPLVFVAAALFVGASALGDAVARRRQADGILARLFPASHLRRRSSLPHALNLLLAATVGLALGVVINPFFPDNLAFFFNQFIQVGVVNFRQVIGVGGEWYPYQPIELLTNTIVLTIPLLVAFFTYALTFVKQSRRSLVLLLLTLLFFAITVKSRRYVEYYVPMGMFFVLSVYSDAFKGRHLDRELRTRVRPVVARWRTFIPSVMLAVYLAILLPTVVVRDLVTQHGDLRQGFRQTQYAEAMRWLREHAPPNAIVVHSDWDEFPILFYSNDRSRYMAGLDATFLYTADPTRYRTWVDITTGVYAKPLLAGLRELGAGYVFVDRDHTAMERLVKNEPALEQVYGDADATVYRVPAAS